MATDSQRAPERQKGTGETALVRAMQSTHLKASWLGKPSTRTPSEKVTSSDPPFAGERRGLNRGPIAPAAGWLSECGHVWICLRGSAPDLRKIGPPGHCSTSLVVTHNHSPPTPQVLKSSCSSPQALLTPFRGAVGGCLGGCPLVLWHLGQMIDTHTQNQLAVS